MRRHSRRGFRRGGIGGEPSNANFFGPFTMKGTESVEVTQGDGSGAEIDVHDMDRRLTALFAASDLAIDTLVNEHREPHQDDKMADMALAAFVRAEAASEVVVPPEPQLEQAPPTPPVGKMLPVK